MENAGKQREAAGAALIAFLVSLGIAAGLVYLVIAWIPV
jgi:hypothetical protein